MQLSTGCEAHHRTGRHPLQMRVPPACLDRPAADDGQQSQIEQATGDARSRYEASSSRSLKRTERIVWTLSSGLDRAVSITSRSLSQAP